MEEQPARLRREEELLTQDEGKPRAGEGVSAETDAWTEHLVRDKRSYPPGHASLVMRTGGSGHCKQCPLGGVARPTPKRGAELTRPFGPGRECGLVTIYRGELMPQGRSARRRL